jgi:kynureninase
MKEILKFLKIKPSHFNDGWANFDEVDYYNLSTICGMGANLVVEINTTRSVTILYEHSELMCFGKISEKGEIVIEGITGFPSDEICVKYLKDVSGLAKKRKIDEKYVYIEW